MDDFSLNDLGWRKLYNAAFREGYSAGSLNKTMEAKDPLHKYRDPTLAGVYVVVVLVLYAVSIAVMIGLMSMKKNRNVTWDKQATGYLQGLYKRRQAEEKRKLWSLTAALGPLPALMLPTVGIAGAGLKRSAFAPTNVAAAVVQPVIGAPWAMLARPSIAQISATSAPAAMDKIEEVEVETQEKSPLLSPREAGLPRRLSADDVAAGRKPAD